MSVKQRIIFKTMIIIYKIINCNMPDYLSDDVQYRRDIHSYTTRNKNNLNIPRYRKNIMHNSTYSLGFQMYNNLPNYLKENELSYEEFKNKIKSYIMDNVN